MIRSRLPFEAGFTAKRRAVYFGPLNYDPATFSAALVTDSGAVIGWHRNAPKFGP